MNEKFQQVYDYLNAGGFLQDGSTADSFMESYNSGSLNLNSIYSLAATAKDFPIEVSSLQQFESDVFGDVKKKI